MIEASDFEDRLNEKYDTIICLSVLEHCINPLLHLKRIKKHLSPNGRIFVAAYFGKTEQHPMHFNSNKTLDEYLTLVGLNGKNFLDHYRFRIFSLLIRGEC